MLPFEEDPTIRTARREAVVVMCIVGAALIYSSTTSYLMGYGAKDRELHFVEFGWGVAFPDWIFWGVVVPWGVCFVIGAIFAFGWMQDAGLGEELEEDDDGSQPASPADRKRE